MSLLFKRQPLVISPLLACRIGLNEAIVLQQICYWIEETQAGVEHAGRKWVYNTIEQWNEQFPFWSPDTVKRSLTSLKKRGLVDVKQLNKAKHDRTNFYAINYDSPLLIDEGNLPSSKRAKAPSSNSGKMPSSKGAKSAFLHTENTTETTSETITGGDSSPPAAGGLPVVLSEEQQQGQGEHKEPSYERIREVFWERFDPAYAARYQGATLPRNTKVNSQVKQLIQRLGREAPAVAYFYVTSVNEQRAVISQHSLDILLKNAEGYRTQWFTGRSITVGQARQIDSTQTNANAADEAIRMFRAQQGKGGEQ